MLSFGAVPIVFNINLFLWFKPDWFYLQFVMVAVGFLAKEFITLEEGRRAARTSSTRRRSRSRLFSLLLISPRSRHRPGAQRSRRPVRVAASHPSVVIFLVGLPGQFLFGVTPMRCRPVVTMFAFGLVYHAVFGTYYFVDALMPVAGVPGMHLLFTDTSTSPRTELGRIIYGVFYGLDVIALFGMPRRAGRAAPSTTSCWRCR